MGVTSDQVGLRIRLTNKTNKKKYHLQHGKSTCTGGPSHTLLPPPGNIPERRVRAGSLSRNKRWSRSRKQVSRKEKYVCKKRMIEPAIRQTGSTSSQTCLTHLFKPTAGGAESDCRAKPERSEPGGEYSDLILSFVFQIQTLSSFLILISVGGKLEPECVSKGKPPPAIDQRSLNTPCFLSNPSLSAVGQSLTTQMYHT